ncbi:Transcription factor kojR [Exophiala dermatitidis]
MPSSGSRRRAKQACETCKLRKRRCDGHEPCSFCLRYEYHCSFKPPAPRKPAGRNAGGSSRRPSEELVESSEMANGRTTSVDQEKMEANSGTAFPHLLGMRLNPQRAPKVHGFSWNLGPRDEPAQAFTNITNMISAREMEDLVTHYLKTIHPLYAILDPDTLHQKVVDRWEVVHAIDSYDPVLCMVAALGSLFSGHNAHPNENAMVQCAKEMLETTCIRKEALLHHATAWLLRTLYLRSTSSPHASWMASCSTMHMIEATGAHQDPDLVSLVYSDTAHVPVGEESHRRLFWVATVLNSWISYEYGRSRVLLRGVSCKTPLPRPGDFTSELIALYQISERLDPDQPNKASDLEDALTRLERLTLSHDALVLSQSNVALTIYRRLRVASPNISSDILTRIIRLGNDGLDAAVRIAMERCPWWHVANVPFQFICILLAMDSRESLSQVGPALRSFRAIARYFSTSMLHTALETIESLVRLSQNKKERDLALLKESMQADTSGSLEHMQLTAPPFSAASWTGTTSDIASLGNFDWDWTAFLENQGPLFDEGA